MATSEGRLRLLYELSCAFASQTELGELIPLVIENCRDVLECAGASVLVLDPEKDELYFPFVAEEDSEAAERLLEMRFPAGQGISGEVLRTGEPLLVEDASADPNFFRGADKETGTSTGPLLAAPFASRNGIKGVIQAVRRTGERPFSTEDLEFLASLAHGVGVAIENTKRFGELRAAQEGLRAELEIFRRDAARRDGFPEIIGSADCMQEVFGLMESAAASPLAVLIEGETGTGKELVARGIHRAGARGSGPFVAVNCAALPEPLLEGELFGHKKGAFTGATRDQKGLFEAASGGTIFLDEVGEMPLAMQAKLLRVLQEGEVVPLGEHEPRPVDVRVISATNRDLESEVDAGNVRADLFYRLAAFPIFLPPLRDRPEDIPLFVAHFAAEAAARHDRRLGGIDPQAIEILSAAEWPGNVRQLQNEIGRAIALGRDGDEIGLQHLSARLRNGGKGTPPPAAATTPAQTPSPSRPVKLPVDPGEVPDLRQARAAFEAWHIGLVLEAQNHNVSRAARSLGLSRAMLQKKMKDYGLRQTG